MSISAAIHNPPPNFYVIAANIDRVRLSRFNGSVFLAPMGERFFREIVANNLN
jgi:hypothetical protein